MTETPEQDWTVVFAGPGEVTAENVKVNLERWLPEHVAAVVLPTKIPRDHKGLKVVDAWLSHKDNFGPDGVDRVEDLNHFLVAPPLDLADTQLYLVVLWGEEGDEETEALVRIAAELEIPTKDLTAGMDDVLFEDKPEPEPEPEPTPARRSRRTRDSDTIKPGDVVNGVTVTRVEHVMATPAEAAAAPKRRGTPRAANVTGPVVPEDTETTPPWKEDDPKTAVDRATLAGITAAVLRAANQDGGVADVLPVVEVAGLGGQDILNDMIDARIAQVFAEFARKLSHAGPGRPRNDGSPAQPRTDAEKVALLLHDDGTYTKRGRGRPAPDQEIVYVDPEEVDGYLDGSRGK
jgi:hypothetical protein